MNRYQSCRLAQGHDHWLSYLEVKPLAVLTWSIASRIPHVVRGMPASASGLPAICSLYLPEPLGVNVSAHYTLSKQALISRGDRPS